MSAHLIMVKKKFIGDGTAKFYGHYSDGRKQWIPRDIGKEWLRKDKEKNGDLAMTKSVTVSAEKNKIDFSDEQIGEVLDGVGAWLYPNAEPSTYWPDEGTESTIPVLVDGQVALHVVSSSKKTAKEGRQFELGKQIAAALPDLVAKLAGELGVSPQDVAQKLCEKLVLALAEKAGLDVTRPQVRAHTPRPRKVDVSLEAERAVREALKRQRSTVVAEPAGVIPSTHAPPPGWWTMAAKAYDEYKRTHPDDDNDDDAVAAELEAH